MFKIKIDQTDKLFSLYIRWRDGWKCSFCQKNFGGPPAQGLHTAHCFSRAVKLTRWDPDNAVACCFNCHYNPKNDNAIDRNQKEKERWFQEYLGEERFSMLEWRHRNPWKFQKPDPKMICIWLKSELEKYENQIIGHRKKNG